MSIFMTTLGLIVLADSGTFRVATTVFIYLKKIISNLYRTKGVIFFIDYCTAIRDT